VKVILYTHVWLSVTVFSGLCEEILMVCHLREWLLTTPLVQQEAHAVLLRNSHMVSKHCHCLTVFGHGSHHAGCF
jgi:hypothetical protein